MSCATSLTSESYLMAWLRAALALSSAAEMSVRTSFTRSPSQPIYGLTSTSPAGRCSICCRFECSLVTVDCTHLSLPRRASRRPETSLPRLACIESRWVSRSSRHAWIFSCIAKTFVARSSILHSTAASRLDLLAMTSKQARCHMTQRKWCGQYTDLTFTREHACPFCHPINLFELLSLLFSCRP
jgi:hypothetical protein